MSKRTFSLLTLFLFGCFTIVHPAMGAVSGWQKGVSIRPNYETDFGSTGFKQSIDNLAATKANYVTLIVPLYQDNPWTTTIYPGWNTPTDGSLISGISYVHSKGMKVNLKVHVDTYDGQWRAHINPGDRSAWFASYRTHLVKYAKMASAQGVSEMTIGAELINMSADDANGTNTTNWKKLIGEVRTLFSGKLTYSANWGGPGWTDEKNRIKFWPDLDYIGVSAYYPLPTNEPNVSNFMKEWEKIDNADLRPLKDKYSKNLLFTEVGYRSLDWAHWAPFEFSGDGAYDPEEQRDLYDALYTYWNNKEYVSGVHWWEWSSNPAAGGYGNKDFTPQGKPAEAIMTKWHAGGTTPEPEPTPTPTPGAQFSASASAQPSSVTVGQPTTITTHITNTGGAVSNTIVDVEVYNANGVQVHQTPYTNQNFATGEKKTFTTSWTPGETGMYTIKLGVFNNNWTVNYIWVDNAGTITVGQGQTPAPTPEAKYSVMTTIDPTTANKDQQITITSRITNSGGKASDRIVDVEIYNNATGAQVHQTPFPGQEFLSGETKTYTVKWIPTTAGMYTVKVGIFNNTWTTNYIWVDNAGTITVQESGTTPSPEPGARSLDIWWPTDGASVSGIQPFQAMVDGLEVEKYDMFWQVDGGTLNKMDTSYEGYPHKRSWVDVSPWRWNSNNQYTIKFVAKSLTGTVLMEKQITITTH